MMGLFEIIYYTGYRLNTARDLARRKRLPVRVISVGNITTGGTSKTPAVVAIAGEARARGFKPCVLTRGYKGRLNGPLLVSPEMESADVGDEPLLMAEKLGEIPVVKGADRHASGMFAIDKFSPPPDLVILDDGFQHRRLDRDMDILLVNAMNPFGNMRLLPMGNLREPLNRMRRADAVVITKSGGVKTEGLAEFVRKYNPDAPVFFSGHSASSVMVPGGSECPAQWLSGRAVYPFSGIAEPESFIDALQTLGADIKGSMVFRDHHAFTPRNISKIEGSAKGCGAEWIITTEKDIMRLKGLGLPENLAALKIEFTVDRGFYDLVFSAITP